MDNYEDSYILYNVTRVKNEINSIGQDIEDIKEQARIKHQQFIFREEYDVLNESHSNQSLVVSEESEQEGPLVPSIQ